MQTRRVHLRLLLLILTMLLPIGMVGDTVGQSSGFSYHSGYQYYVHLGGGPSVPVNGHYGYSGWIYTNPGMNATDPDGVNRSAQTGWFTIYAGGQFHVEVGHGQNYGAAMDVFFELWPDAITPGFTCRNGAVAGAANCYANASTFGVGANQWYEVRMGDYWEDSRWKFGIKLNGYLIAVVDYDLGNTGGLSSFSGLEEFINNNGIPLSTLYSRGMSFGSSFDAFWDAIGTNGMDGPFEEITSRTTLTSSIFDAFGISYGYVGCNDTSPGGNGQVRQTTAWRGATYRVGSHAHGTYPLIWGNCYPYGYTP